MMPEDFKPVFPMPKAPPERRATEDFLVRALRWCVVGAYLVIFVFMMFYYTVASALSDGQIVLDDYINAFRVLGRSKLLIIILPMFGVGLGMCTFALAVHKKRSRRRTDEKRKAAVIFAVMCMLGILACIFFV